MDHPQTPRSESPGYDVPEEDASKQTTHEQLSLSKITQVSSTRTAEEDLRDFNPLNSQGNHSGVASGTSKQSIKMNASSIQIMTQDTDVSKRLRSEISGMNNQVVSSFNEKDFINLDSAKNLSSASANNHSLNNISLPGIYQEILNTKKSHTLNQVLEGHDCESNKNSCKYEKNNALKMNIPLKDHAVGKITFSEASKVKIVRLLDEILAIPGQSSSHLNMPQSNLCPDQLKNSSPLKQQLLVDPVQRELTCFLCKKKNISEHWEAYDEKKMYICCQCLFKSKSEICLLKHIFKHPSAFYCNACKLSYSNKGSHDSGQTCEACEKYFECKYQLEDHYFLIHEEEHERNCRICRKEINEHYNAIERESLYKCCYSKCTYENRKIFDFKQHLYIHSHLKLFKCEDCGNRFKQSSGLRNHLPTCENIP